MNHSRLRAHKLTNLLQSVLLLGGMAVLLALLGWTLAGFPGVVWAMLLGTLALALGPTLSPQVILRLYGAQRIAPGQAPELHALLAELAERAALPATPQLYYVPSPMMNAFAVGRSDRAAIAVTDGLLRGLSFRELAGVVAHEMSHVRNNDMWVMGLADVVSRVTGVLSMTGQILLLVNLPFLLVGQVAVPWLAVLLLIFAPTLSALMQLALSRAREYDADLDAATLTRDPRGLASALARLERQSAGWLEQVLMPGRRIPDPSLLRTHPPTRERIRRLLSLASEETAWQSLRETPMDMRHLGPARHAPRWHLTGLWY